MTAPSHESRREQIRPPGAGRRAWWMLVCVVRSAGRVLRGLIAAAVLVALVAGLPWALWHYIGWPLPDHVPAWAEVEGVLLGPMTTTFLLDFIACLCWATWTAFTIDVLRCTVDLARSGFDVAIALRDFSAAGPMHALAGVLVGAALLSVLGNRPTPAPATSLSTALGSGSQVVATAPAWQHPAHGEEKVAVRNAVVATRTTAGGDAATVSAPTHPESVVVRPPEGGIHDSLWRIAERTLGDGTRWPEIFELNQGKSQPNGHPFTRPSLIFPGEELALPREASAPAVPPQRPADPDQSSPTSPSPPPTTSAPPTSNQPPAPVPPTHQTPPAATDTDNAPVAPGEPGFQWGPELFVSLGLTAAISATLLVVRRRYRDRYRPGSGDRDDLPVAPVVYQLRLAHLRTEVDDEIDLGDDPDDEQRERPQRVPPQPPLVVGAPRIGASRHPTLAPGLGVRDGREVALDLATARGLGLVGPGASAAARALLIAVLTTPGHLAKSAGAMVVVPADDLASVLGRGATHEHVPSAVRVVADLDDALDAVEAETLVRAFASSEHGTGPGMWPPLVLVAKSSAHHQRLQAVLDNGVPFAVTGLLLGQWQPGVTAYVRQDGTISATGPGLGEALRGTRMFRLDDDDTTELLTLLRQAEPDPPVENDLVLGPVLRPRIVAAQPTGKDHRAQEDTDRLKTGHAKAGEVELEVTAAVTRPASPDTELEISGPAPGVRLRPPDTGRRWLAASGVTDAAVDERKYVGEVGDDEPAPTDEPTTAAAQAAPTVTPGGEQDVNSALITITMLGGLRVHWHSGPGATDSPREITGALQPRTKELLVLLGLHPDGATREALVSALWGQDPPTRPTNALHTALSRMRSALATATDGAVGDIVSAGNGRYQLDPARVRVDYWRFARAVVARRSAATDATRLGAYRDVVNAYGGPLAEGMSAEWIEPAREAIRRDAIDAVAALARALIDFDPQQTLDLLEIARTFDPHNELLYRDIMRLQERLGQLDAIPRTLTLLTTRLAEVDAAPTPQARELAARLGQRHEDVPAGPANSGSRRDHGRSVAG